MAGDQLWGAAASGEREPVLSVSALTLMIKETLEGTFPAVWVAGEVSNISRPHSGHVYLTLKDDQAQLRAVMWRNSAQRLAFDLKDGQEVICEGSLDLYPPRGSYQLVVRQMEPRGEGALQLALRQLHTRLAAEGLFDPAHKQPLPAFPRRIAVVTSPTGAAIRDFLEVVRRRWTGIHVYIIPARVQGNGAAGEIAAGIELANRMADPPEVLVVCRGGGSLEDLWCFNEEPVIRAIFASRIPVVSAVGHEIDVTLSDLVADVRALTPSEAAERIVPSRDEILGNVKSLGARLAPALRSRVQRARLQLDALAASRPLARPFERLRELARRLDELDLRMQQAGRKGLSQAEARVQQLAGRLESLSPLAVLSRGYSLTQHAEDARLLRSAAEVSPGDLLRTRLAAGSLISRVEQVEPAESNLDAGDAGSVGVDESSDHPEPI